MAKSLEFLTCGIDTLELRMIQTVLKKHDFTLKDIEQILKRYSDEALHRYMMQQVEAGQVCLMPNVPLDRMEDEPYLSQLAILRPSDIPGGMSVLAQICAIIGHQSSRYENLVSSFAAGHIRGLRAAGATEEEVQQIALRDRLARGGTMQDERLVAQHVRNIQLPQGNTQVYETLLYASNDSVFESVERRRTLIDYALYRADDTDAVTVVFDRMDREYRIYLAEIYTTNRCDVRAAQRIAKRYRFICTTPVREPRTGMHMVKLSAHDRTKDVESIRDLLHRYRRFWWE